MLYKLLGMAVWNGARWYLRRRFGAGGRRRALLGAAAFAVAAAGVAVASRRGRSAP